MTRLLLMILLLAGCAPAASAPPAPLPPTAPPATSTPRPTVTPFPTPTRRAEPTPTETVTPIVDQFTPYTIDYLRSREYGGGGLEILETRQLDGFTRYTFNYPSDGLVIHGYINIPDGMGPFPIVYVLHGYAEPENYQPFGHMTNISDALARDGYAAIYTDMRNYPPSQSGDDYLRVGYAIDVLNLIAIVKQQSGVPGGLLERLDARRMGLYGHSLGGGIVLRVLTISKDIKAAILYASISGDERKNAQLFYDLTEQNKFLRELETPADALLRISPSSHYLNITATIGLFHGTADSVVPVSFAEETCLLLRATARNVECTFYPDGGHTFLSRYRFGEAAGAFLERYLKNQ